MKPTHMLPSDLQRSNEYQFSRKHIDTYMRQIIDGSSGLQEAVKQGVNLLQGWLSKSYYSSKDARLNEVKKLNLEELVHTIFIASFYCQMPMSYTTLTAQLAVRLGWAERRDSILTMAEIVAVVADTDVYDIGRASKYAPITLTSRVRLPEKLMDAVERSQYILPMVSEPEDITHNFESPYLTFNECQILGSGNRHDGNICLDVINIQNSIPLKLDIAFLSHVEEKPSYEPSKQATATDTQEKLRQWNEFVRQSKVTYQTLIRQGNRFWLTNKVDKRGRLYAQGYHVHSQGTTYKKAMLELAEGEVVTGVPAQFQK